MTYHTTIILLFRPFGNQRQIAGISASPWELCTASANSIVTLLKLYRSRFSLRYIVHLAVHCLFTASIIHLANATSVNESLQRSSKNALRVCFSGFEEIGEIWASASKSLHVLKSLQHKWNLKSPTPTEESTQTWPQNVSYPPITKSEFEFEPVMPRMAEGNLTNAYIPDILHQTTYNRNDGLQQYFLPTPPPATPTGMVHTVPEHLNPYSESGLFDYLPFLDSGYPGHTQ
jgi:hypothetical protein